MKSYQLESKAQDTDFLSGKEVRCRAVVDVSKDTVNKGDSILVMLSNGKKYKGRIADFIYFDINKFGVGELIITRG